MSVAIDGTGEAEEVVNVHNEMKETRSTGCYQMARLVVAFTLLKVMSMTSESAGDSNFLGRMPPRFMQIVSTSPSIF